MQNAKTTTAILKGKDWIFHVAHKPGLWEFYPVDHFDAKTLKVVCSFDDVLNADSSIAKLSDLEPGWRACRQNKNAVWEKTPTPQGKLYLLTYEATTTVQHHKHAEIAGAIINAFVVAKSKKAAQEIALREIEEAHFSVIANLESSIISNDDEFDEDTQKYINQAKFDGLTVVFHCYPYDNDN